MKNDRSGVPVALKLGASLALILGVGALPARFACWGLLAIPPLLAVAWRAGVARRALLKRLLACAPFLLGIAALSLFQPYGAWHFIGLLIKSSVSVLTLQLLASTTPISELLRALRRAQVPEVLCNTIALLHRYLFLVIDESKRMRRARRGRTLRSSRWATWRTLGNSVGLLFVRSVFRAERVQAAIRSRSGS